MAKATYYYKNGSGSLIGIPVDADKDGNLTPRGCKEPTVTGAEMSTSAANGVYVLDIPEKSGKKKEKTEAPDPVAEQQELEAAADAAGGKDLSSDLPPDA